MSLTSTPDVTAIPAGFVLVPIEPTPEMIAAYLNANTEYWHATDALPKPANKWRTGTPPEATAAGYRAMLSAAPVAPIEAAASSHEQEIAIRESLEANAILIWGPHFAYSSTDERVFSQGFRSGWGAREHPKTVTSLAFPVAVPAITVAPAVPEGWQPIETAPKETLVMVYTPPKPDDWPDGVRIDFDFICPDYEDWHHHCESFEHYMAVGGSNAAGPDCVCIGPSQKAPYTHWHAIPAAPTAAMQATGATP